MKALNNDLPIIQLSNCCKSNVYKAPAYYSSNMKTNKGDKIPMINVCLKCGCECKLINTQKGE